MIDDGPDDTSEALARLERGDKPSEVMRDMIWRKMQRMIDENPLTEAEERLYECYERRDQQRRWLVAMLQFGMN